MTPASTPAAVDRVDRAANPGLLALLVVCLCGAVAAMLWLPEELGVKASNILQIGATIDAAMTVARIDVRGPLPTARRQDTNDVAFLDECVPECFV